jgi:hypothetical protein
MNIPEAKKEIDRFIDSNRKYWRRNVKKYFSKRENVYNLPVKMDHRISIAKRGEARLSNALEVKWNPSNNHVTMKIAPIMVKSVNAGSGGQVNLIDILAKGTGVSAGKWVKYAVYMNHTYIDKRIKYNGQLIGTRGPQSNQPWIAWMGDFTSHMNERLEELNERLANIIGDTLEHEITVPEEF